MKMLLFALGVAWLLASAPPGAAEPAAEDSVKKYRFLAKDAREKSDTREALRYYAEYLKYRPDDARAYFWVGELNYDLQDLPAARRAFGQALALDSLHLNSNFRLAEVFRLEGQADSAASYLDRLLRLKPDESTYLELQRKLAELYYTQQNFPLALRHYLRFAESDSARQDPPLIELIADLYEGQGEPALALEWRQRLLGAGAGADSAGGALADRVPILEKMAELQAKAGDTRAALATLGQLVQLDSLNRYAYYSRYVQVAEKGGDPAARLRGLEGMAQANAKDPEPPLKLAEAYLNAGDPKAAERWVERGLRADPRNAYLFLLKGDCLARQSQEDQAVAAYERAKADPAWAAVAQQRIWQLRPPESQEEKLKREFFGKGKNAAQAESTKQ
jgi:tetratricopeptide (TPR) repeat protein